MAFAGEKWKGDGADGDWQEGFSRLDLDKQLEIRELADKKFNGNIVAAMKHKFQGEISKVLRRRSVKAEAEELTKNAQFQEDLRKLLEGGEEISDDTAIPEDQELKNWKKRGRK